ncbi:MAG: hypothetical protein Q8K60_05270 [Parachlamydiaceae bacterium]|nr:hypothetical protein [Parachlamydiaceae bacterium]
MKEQRGLIECFSSIELVRGNSAALDIINEVWTRDLNDRIKSIIFLNENEQQVILKKARQKAVQDYMKMAKQTNNKVYIEDAKTLILQLENS